MQISNIQNLNFTSTQQKYKRPRNYVYNETLNMDSFEKKPIISPKNKRRIAGAIVALDIFGIGLLLGDSVGYNRAKDEFCKEEVIEQNLYPDFNKDEVIENIFFEDEDVSIFPTSTPEIAPTSAPSNQIPQIVYELANGEYVTEIDLSRYPLVNSGIMPTYLENAGIDKEVLASAQSNVARIYEAGNYIIICPKADTTMGTLKAVFGIIDGAADIEENKLKTRKLLSGSKGNLDDAIIPANDAIKIERYNQNRGHQIGAFLFHKSNRSRNKIIEIIKNNTKLY